MAEFTFAPLTPVAFLQRSAAAFAERVAVADGEVMTEKQVIEHVRSRLARFKAPRKVVFAALPKTSTGKIQKNVLRARVRSDAGGGA